MIHHIDSSTFVCIATVMWLKLNYTFMAKQVVNLIPFNPIGSSSQFRTSGDEKVSVFQKVLRGTYNIRTTVRKQMGQDISGACGQLVVSLPNRSSGRQTSVLPDIEDLHLWCRQDTIRWDVPRLRGISTLLVYFCQTFSSWESIIIGVVIQTFNLRWMFI